MTAPLRKLTQGNVKFHCGSEERAAFEKLKDSISSENTMIFFNPNKPIVVKAEASYHDGLSAGLFQDMGKACAFYKSYHDKYGETVQPDRKGRISNPMGKEQTKNVSSRCTQI